MYKDRSLARRKRSGDGFLRGE